MKYLVDTHILLWTIFEPEKLPNKFASLFKKEQAIFSVSDISFWEISLKYGIGKLQLNGVRPEKLPAVSRQMGYEIIPITTKLVASVHQLPRNTHKDPFDRLLIWQALQQDFVFISRDSRIQEYLELGLKVVS